LGSYMTRSRCAIWSLLPVTVRRPLRVFLFWRLTLAITPPFCNYYSGHNQMALYRSLALYCRLKFHRWRLDVLSLTTRGDLGSSTGMLRPNSCVSQTAWCGTRCQRYQHYVTLRYYSTCDFQKPRFFGTLQAILSTLRLVT